MMESYEYDENQQASRRKVLQTISTRVCQRALGSQGGDI